MTREELEQAFPEHGARVALTRRVEGAGTGGGIPASAGTGMDDVVMRGEVWEVWDRQRREPPKVQRK
jgi:hypothetical protein